MDFADVCKCYLAIEGTKRRGEIISTLADMLSDAAKSGPEDLARVVYLTQGQLYPNWKTALRLGVAVNMAIQAISQAAGVTSSVVDGEVRGFGDIGKAAEKLLSNRKAGGQQTLTALLSWGAKNNSLQVGDIYDKLGSVAQKSGQGSAKRKLDIVAAMFSKATPPEARYLARIIIGELRLGVADQTVIAAIAAAFVPGSSGAVERAYNLHPDLGDIARMAASGGKAAVDAINPVAGMPIRMMLAGRVDSYREILPKLGTCIAEHKLDGERLQIHINGDTISIFSRQLTNITKQYPDVCDAIRRAVTVTKPSIIEGEVVAMDANQETMLPFQMVARRKRKSGVEGARQVTVSTFLFDVLMANGVPTIDMPFPERRRVLASIVKPDSDIRLVEGREVKSDDELVKFFGEARAAGTEGVICKATGPDSNYTPGARGLLWVKMKGLSGAKMADTIDAVIVGAYHGMGKRAGAYGGFLVATRASGSGNFETLTKIGTGFSEDDFAKMTMSLAPHVLQWQPPKVVHNGEPPDVWIEPTTVIEVAADEFTVSQAFACGNEISSGERGYSVRFSVFQRIRDDKSAADVTTDREVVAMYDNTRVNQVMPEFGKEEWHNDCQPRR